VPGEFEALMGELDPPMFLVTCQAPGEGPAGCLVGFATQCSIEPRRFLAAISRANHTCPAAARSAHLAVHLVPGGAAPLAELFGGETGDEVDKFADCAWRPGPGGAPVLDDCPNWFVGRVCERLDLGDHVGFLLDPLAVSHGEEEPEPLGLKAAAAGIEPGHPA
jgi:flavin reductase (DIM6/NTAB) family NADH-FMN oxidoreductase RutF